MDTKPIDDLVRDPNNPRTINDFAGQSLVSSMEKYGDLSPIVFNRRLGKLVGGNTRVEFMVKHLLGHNRVAYITQYEAPDAQGTVALGHVWHNNTPFAYREVEFDEVTHREASIAANRIHGDFVEGLLAEANQFILENGGDLSFTGQTDEEIEALLRATGPDPEPAGDSQASQDDGLKSIHAKFTDDQLATVYEAIGLMKRQRTLTGELNSDLDANALYYICRSYVETLTSQNIENREPELSQELSAKQPTSGESETPPDELPAEIPAA